MTLPMNTIRALVGDISETPFQYIDFAVTDTMGLFVPVSGQCDYSMTPEHTHPAYSFVVNFDDACRVKLHDAVVRSRPGTFTAFSPDVPHQELPLEAPARYVAVMVAPTYFEAALAVYGRPLPTLCGEQFDAPPRLVAALREFMAEYEEHAPGFASLLEASAKTITHLIIRQLLAVQKQDDKVDFRMAANHAVAFMHTHLNEKLTLTDLARVARLSPSQFSRVFKAELGAAPIEYLHALRLIRAKRLLRDSDKTITEIALDCGFGSSSYFARCFVRRFGVSASDYRKAIGMPR